MPRRERISCTVGDEPTRDYLVTYTDDSPERAEAVAFFNSLTRPLFPVLRLPEVIEGMPHVAAQDYLDQHPMQQQWSSLRVLSQDGVTDDDLARLQFVPELEYLFLYGVGDNALRHVVYLCSLKELAVYSNKVTDQCLTHVRSLQSLRSIDFQGSQNVSQAAFADLVADLPSLVEVYSPYTR